MDLPHFLALNEAMALRALLDQILRVETLWDDVRHRQAALQDLLDLLEAASSHRGPRVRQLASLRSRIPVDPNFHQFMSLVVPIEREYSRATADGDFPVAMDDRAEPKAERLMPLTLVLDNLRSAFNLGSIWRLAECLGVSRLLLTGYTATPEQAKVSRSALGTEKLVAWEWFPHFAEAVAVLRSEHAAIYALETSAVAQSIDAFVVPQQKVALVLGNERYGLEADRLQLCDGVIEIPCWGRKNSLNVAVTAGIAVHEVRRQWMRRGLP